MFWRRKPRFEELAAEVLEEKRLRAKNTLASATLQLTRLNSYFGRISVHRITEKEWIQYIAFRRKAQPTCRLFDDRKYMRQVMLLAYRQGHLRRKLKLWIPDRPSTVGREILPAELVMLFAKARPLIGFQMEIALKMGLRLRELLHLRWDRVDWESRVVRLYPEDVKTLRGRIVPINPDLYERLKKRHETANSPFVFPNPYDPSKPQHTNKDAWKRVRRKAMVRCRWHDFRHTCATVMLRRGVSVSAASRLLGMSEKVLQHIYQHLNLEDLRRAGEVMSDAKTT